jgi:hypothetical protein
LEQQILKERSEMEFAGIKFVANAAVPDGKMIVLSAEEVRRIEVEASRQFQAMIDQTWRNWFGEPGRPVPPCKCRIVHMPGCPNFCP